MSDQSVTHRPDLRVGRELKLHLQSANASVSRVQQKGTSAVTYPVDGEEQALEFLKLGGGEAKQAGIPVSHSTCCALILLQSI